MGHVDQLHFEVDRKNYALHRRNIRTAGAKVGRQSDLSAVQAWKNCSWIQSKERSC